MGIMFPAREELSGEIWFVFLGRRRVKRCLDGNKPDINKGVSGRCREWGGALQGKKPRQRDRETRIPGQPGK